MLIGSILQVEEKDWLFLKRGLPKLYPLTGYRFREVAEPATGAECDLYCSEVTEKRQDLNVFHDEKNG